MELTAATLTALWAVTSFYFWQRDTSFKRIGSAVIANDTATDEVLIAFASQSGQSRDLATQYYNQLLGAKPALAADVSCISQITPESLSKYRRVFLIASTYGQGEPPDSARPFVKAIASLPDNSMTTRQLQFAVLGLGDSSYPHFCAFGHWLHSQLCRLGAQSISPCIEVDRLAQLDLTEWQQLLELTLECKLTAQPQILAYRLNDRRLLNPGSPNPGLFWLRLEPQQGNTNTPTAGPVPGDLIDIHLSNGERRTYSLANAPATTPPGMLELIVRQHYCSDGTPGLGSNYLSERIDAGSQLKISFRRGFDWTQIPAECPLILIGAGSGLAGVRAGLQARQRQHSGANWVIFGERDPVYDRPCEDELLGWNQLGLLSRLDRVWSQAPPEASLRYAQDVLYAHSAELSSYLIQGGYIYVCGSARGFGAGVNESLMQLLGEPQVTTLRDQGRYIRDIY